MKIQGGSSPMSLVPPGRAVADLTPFVSASARTEAPEAQVKRELLELEPSCWTAWAQSFGLPSICFNPGGQKQSTQATNDATKQAANQAASSSSFVELLRMLVE